MSATVHRPILSNPPIAVGVVAVVVILVILRVPVSPTHAILTDLAALFALVCGSSAKRRRMRRIRQ